MTDRLRLWFTASVALVTCALLTWQQLHGGVPAHSFLSRDDMPSISNWWGALSLPLFTWFAVGNTQRRVALGRSSNRSAVMAAIGAAAFGTVLAVSYSLGYSEVPRLQVRLLPLLALALPIYRAEYLLGFVLALSYTFGGVLPIVIGSIFALGGSVVHLAPRWLLRRFRVKH
ncbi:hypothetical protein Strain138_000437 [Pseudogemmatithrix spongiicola]|uniref:Uncharacterized protein n=1 Tax=Pseudogemmatithrix spongiicola TaxID=3062599 RepID=A0AA49Q3U7_9BACT|nr:hypothetical protein Strain138_000437 [Gemmatimonadaceae bacterium 'strain 138']WKW14112.1 hypothetical protein Strain318_000437 [Gemmatimonadaceae bacterium 'strain 318']